MVAHNEQDNECALRTSAGVRILKHLNTRLLNTDDLLCLPGYRVSPSPYVYAASWRIFTYYMHI
jgi:hypothetical protein